MQLNRELDWVIKREWIQSYMDRNRLSWRDPKISLMDLQYHDIRPDRGIYYRLAARDMVERVTDDEMHGMFDKAGDRVRVKAWLREDIRWRIGDACDQGLVEALGHQDVVVANDFLCHMEPAEAEACLRNLACLVDAGGYLVVSGIDLDVRTKIATDLGWTPVRDSLEEIHDGDPVLRWGWPWGYWGLEPLDKSRPDWIVRYASVFQLGSKS